MSVPDDKRRRNPVDRFRRILSAERDEQRLTETRKPPVVNLPRVKAGPQETDPESDRDRTTLPAGGDLSSRGLRSFWTITSIFSIGANLVLFALVIGLLRAAGRPSGIGFDSQMLGGLYASLEQMDLTHVRATIPLQTSFPLSVTSPIQTTTSIRLAQDVIIQEAHVKINTGGLNIDAPASITLPAGTVLSAALDFKVPLQTDVPIALDLPVDIAVRNTELHAPLSGLQAAIRPALCEASPRATSMGGQLICP